MRRILGDKRSLLSTLGLTAWLAVGALAYVQQDATKKKTPGPKAADPIVAAPELPLIQASRLSSGGTYDNQPAVTEAADGTTWTAWIRFKNHGADEVVVSARRNGSTAPPQVLSPRPGQYIRPALAASGSEVWCVWTTSEPDRVSSIWYSRCSGNAWTTAARLLPEEPRAHQNPEIAAGPGGRAAVVYQVHTGKAYDIHLRIWDGKAWSIPQSLNAPGIDGWDPAVTFDSKGLVHAVWCGFQDGDYDIYWKRGEAEPRRLSARGEYDLHPSIAPSSDGTVWVSWDVVVIPHHASSGRTTITGANLKKGMDESHGKAGAKSSIDVRVLDGDTIRVPGKPREEITAPKGYLIAHCGMAKIAVGPAGEPWIFHRALRRAANVGGIGYYWDLLGRPFRQGRWQEPVRFAEADGYLEEPGLATSPEGIRVAYGGEHRSAHLGRGAKVPAADESQPHDHHRDFDSRRGWNGETYLATAEALGPGPERTAMAGAGAPDDRHLQPRPRMKPYSTDIAGKTAHLYFGDLHRHSNVSRCSQGGEPTPDDLYRYGTDICRYDFFGLSDHAEDPRQTGYDVIDYYWWKQQKLADLYHIPGFMSVLYNLEWSLGFPHGHHNTVFPARPTQRLDRSIAASSTLAKGWKVLDENHVKAITIPHTGADPSMGTAWDVQDDRYQRVCEIFQACRGSYEHPGCPREFSNTRNKKGFYWNALEKGYHVGVISSSDHGYGVAYACVYAPENTREAIWQALYDRRCYGSTTYGLILELKSGEHFMGEEWASKEAPALEIFVKGAAPIRSVEILGRSKVLHAEGGVDKPLGANEHRIRWTDPDWGAQTAEQWYYVRVIQSDDEMAWSSPVWVKPAR
jgi:hypothetical protein